ncbi:MAG: hypothetical protein QW666_02940, partial [Candidatus Woesearchaeota archaeon]
EDLMELDGLIWKAKKDKGLSLRADVKEAVIPESFKCIEQDLKLTHRILSLSYGKETRVML